MPDTSNNTSPEQLLDLLHNAPSEASKRVQLPTFVTAVGVGKSTPVSVIFLLYLAVETTEQEHQRRLRGLFVHRHKKKARRQHRRRASWLDQMGRKNVLQFIRDCSITKPESESRILRVTAAVAPTPAAIGSMA